MYLREGYDDSQKKKKKKKLAPRKGIRIAESEKILLVESGIPGFRNTAQGIWIPPTIGIWDPSSTDK